MTVRLLDTDTIAAIATAPGMGAIGIVRVSGPGARDVLSRVFRAKGKGRISGVQRSSVGQALSPDGLSCTDPGPSLPSGRVSTPADQDLMTHGTALFIGTKASLRRPEGLFSSHRIYYGRVIDPETGEAIDQAMVCFMAAPKSYTCEDTVEIYTHGSRLVLNQVLRAALSAGARMAEPGEFTKRAFLNGRIDLAQAEAVADMIAARSEQSLKWARAQLDGELSRQLTRIKHNLVELLADMEAALDFPEEDLELAPVEQTIERIEGASREIVQLLSSYERTRPFREGVCAVIVGAPNVGKSSLLNALLRRERAITSPVPGTTRDFIEEQVLIHGLPVRLIDTAGLGPDPVGIEAEGMGRTRRWLEAADLVLCVIDGSRPLIEEDLAIVRELTPKKGLVVVNKTDLPAAVTPGEVQALLPSWPVVLISALNGNGLAELEEEVHRLAVGGGEAEYDGAVISSERHREALERARKGLEGCRGALGGGFPLEIAAADLRDALGAMGEVTGEVTTEEVLDLIFSRFCIGK